MNDSNQNLKWTMKIIKMKNDNNEKEKNNKK